MSAHPQPARPRALGRSRLYQRSDVPERLFQWHAPRANRWVRLRIESGRLAVEHLQVEGVERESMQPGDTRWIAPGSRWRIVHMDDAGSFHLEVHADESIEPSAPQPRRAVLLDEATPFAPPTPAALTARLGAMQPGERCLVRTAFDPVSSLRATMAQSGGRLCWHPLAAGPHWAALVACAAQPIDMLEYLGRDHAVIEAALTGALRGDATRMAWLRNALARHLVIEEEILFPAYLEAGGTRGWVDGLLKEHRLLERQIDQLDDRDARRRFMLLLEAHDEKEEQVVYPDILARFDDGAAALTQQIMAIGPVHASAA